MAARGAYGPLLPGSPLEQLALLGLDEEQSEEIAKVTFLGQAMVGAKEEHIQKSYKNFLHMAAPQIHEDVAVRDERMKSILEQEVKKGAFNIISLQPDDRNMVLRKEPREKRKKRGINTRKPAP